MTGPAHLGGARRRWTGRWAGARLGRTGGLLLLLALLAVQGWVYRYPEVLFKRPQGYHAWRQSDCLSMTWHYMEQDLPPWEGRMHFLGTDGTGRALSELPLLPYGIGRLWRLTGPQEWLYRAVVLLLSLGGMIALYRTAHLLLKDGVLSAWVAAFLFTSPMVAYYANNFLPNAAALALALMGTYPAAAGLVRGDRRKTLLAIALFTAAGLLKATAALGLLVLLALHGLQLITRRNTATGSADRRAHGVALLGGGFGLALIAAWYGYARAYNAGQAQGIFLIGVLPWWSVPPDEARAVWQGFLDHVRRDYLRPDLYLVLLAVLVPALLAPRRVPRLLWAAVVLLACGTVAIGVLFFGALRDHDYYTLDQAILFPALLLTGLAALVKGHPQLCRSWPFQVILLAVLVHGTDFARRRMADRYGTWMNHEYLAQHEPLGRMQHELLHMGVDRDARVLCFPDISFNRSLYLLQRSGWTDFGALSDDPEAIRAKQRLGASFLITTSDSVLGKSTLRPFLNRPVGRFENVRVFDLRPAP